MQPAHRRSICCLLALAISDYEAKPIFDQIRLTQDFSDLLSDATARVPSHDLISAVGEDGGVLAFLCDPVDCLTAALAIRDATLTQDRYRDLQVRIGIDLGKVDIAEDASGQEDVSGEGRQDAERLMRQGPPGQVSFSRRFVELLSRNAPELAESLEYQGACCDDIGPPLYWYRAPAPLDIASETASDRPTSASSSDGSHTRIQSKLAPVALAIRSIVKLQPRLLRPRLGYALLLLLVGSAIVAWSVRVSVNPPASKPSAEIGVVPPSAAWKAPESSPAPAKSFLEGIDSLPGSVLPEETIGPAAMRPPELINNSHEQQAASSSPLLPQSIEKPAVTEPHGERRAPGHVNNATPEKKQPRSKSQSKKPQGQEPRSTAGHDATTDSMLACAMIQVPSKRLECFDKLKRRTDEQARNAGKG